MTPEQAATLAATMTSSWPRTGVAHDTWTAKFTPLDYDATLTTIGRLVDTCENPPSVAQFIAAYRASATPARLRYQAPCAICDGTGWEQITAQRPNYPMQTTGVVPCRCTNGRTIDEAHRRAVDANDHELRRRPTPAAA